MGEIAEMMLDGTLDCETGEYLGEGHGIPRTARSMAKDEHAYAYQFDPVPKKPKTSKCPTCGKMFRGIGGVHDHMKAVHKITQKYVREQIIAEADTAKQKKV